MILNPIGYMLTSSYFARFIRGICLCRFLEHDRLFSGSLHLPPVISQTQAVKSSVTNHRFFPDIGCKHSYYTSGYRCPIHSPSSSCCLLICPLAQLVAMMMVFFLYFEKLFLFYTPHSGDSIMRAGIGS